MSDLPSSPSRPSLPPDSPEICYDESEVYTVSSSTLPHAPPSNPASQYDGDEMGCQEPECSAATLNGTPSSTTTQQEVEIVHNPVEDKDGLKCWCTPLSLGTKRSAQSHSNAKERLAFKKQLRITARARLRRRHLDWVARRMRFRVSPMYPLPDGPPCPDFPKTLLQYYLLTEEQLDNIARYYHQVTFQPCIWTNEYPSPMDWDVLFIDYVGKMYGDRARIEIKKRKVGRFMGLGDCNTPSKETEFRDRFHEERKKRGHKDAGSLDFWGRRGNSF